MKMNFDRFRRKINAEMVLVDGRTRAGPRPALPGGFSIHRLNDTFRYLGSELKKIFNINGFKQ